MKDDIRVTPLLGCGDGRKNEGTCTLLEIGGARLLLDCGCTANYDYAALTKVMEDIVER